MPDLRPMHFAKADDSSHEGHSGEGSGLACSAMQRSRAVALHHWEFIATSIS